MMIVDAFTAAHQADRPLRSIVAFVENGLDREQALTGGTLTVNVFLPINRPEFYGREAMPLALAVVVIVPPYPVVRQI